MNRDDIHTREATNSDARLFFEWANDPAVRMNAFNQDDITWSDHLPWFEARLKNEHSKIFVLQWNENPLGQIRFDRKDYHWLIDYSISKQYRGKGLGKLIVELGLKALLPLTKPQERIIAKVKQENIPSIRVFEDLGFAKESQADMMIFEYSIDQIKLLN